MWLPTVLVSGVVWLAAGRSPMSSVPPRPNVTSPSYVPKLCFWSPERGTCRDYAARYFFNTTSGHCERFQYGGCGGNGNNFMTLADCRRKCACNLPPETGPCRGYMRRWFYSPANGACKPFVYGGCGGNSNRYSSWADCSNSCGYPGDLNKQWGNGSASRKRYSQADFVHDWMLLGRLGEGGELDLNNIMVLMKQVQMMGGLSTMKGGSSVHRGGATTGPRGWGAGGPTGGAVGGLVTGAGGAGTSNNNVADVATLMAVFGQEMELGELMYMIAAAQSMKNKGNMANNAHAYSRANSQGGGHGSGSATAHGGWRNAGRYSQNGVRDNYMSRGVRGQASSTRGYGSSDYGQYSATNAGANGVGAASGGRRVASERRVRGGNGVSGSRGFNPMGHIGAASGKMDVRGGSMSHAGGGNWRSEIVQSRTSTSGKNRKGVTGTSQGEGNNYGFQKRVLDGTFGNAENGAYILKLIRQFGSGRLSPRHLNAIARRFDALNPDGSVNVDVLARRLIGSLTGKGGLTNFKGVSSLATRDGPGNSDVKVVLNQLRNYLMATLARLSRGEAAESGGSGMGGVGGAMRKSGMATLSAAMTETGTSRGSASHGGSYGK